MISVIILTYNRRSELLRCLARLAEQFPLRGTATGTDLEVIVIDNGSTDGTEQAVRDFSALPIRFVDNRADSAAAASFASARNLGVRLARDDIVAFLDDDCEPDADWLERIAESLSRADRRSCLPDAVGGMVLPPPGIRYPLWWDLELNWLVGLSPPGMLKKNSAGTYYPQTANMAVRREVLLKEPFQETGIGFFAAGSVYRAGREDAELWRRLRLRGYKTVLDPNLRVRHHIPQSRFRLSYIARRAYIDGVTYYAREEKEGYCAVAADDMARAPFRAVRNFAQPSTENALPREWRELFGGFPRAGGISAVVRQGVWALRQAGFLRAYLGGDRKVFRVLRIAQSFTRAYGSAVAGIVKRAARTLTVAGYRQLAPRKKFSSGKALLRTTPRSILVVGCGFLGDMVIMLPSMKLLRERFPSSRLVFLTHRVGKEFCERLGIFDEIIRCPARGEPGGQSKRLANDLRRSGPFDVSLIEYFHNAPPRALFTRTTGLRISYDRDVGFRRQVWYDLADVLVHKDLGKNELENSGALLEPLGITQPLKPYALDVPQEAAAAVERLLEQLGMSGRRIVVFHPESVAPYKVWSNERWIELARRIEAAGDFGIVIPCFLTPPSIFDHLGRKHGIRARCIYLPGLWDLAALIKRASLLVTLDSGPKHFAFALGTPTITLYGQSDERRWGALWDADQHLAVRACTFDLSYEELLNLPPNHQMLCITPQRVFEVFARLLPLPDASGK